MADTTHLAIEGHVHRSVRHSSDQFIATALTLFRRRPVVYSCSILMDPAFLYRLEQGKLQLQRLQVNCSLLILELPYF